MPGVTAHGSNVWHHDAAVEEWGGEAHHPDDYGAIIVFIFGATLKFESVYTIFTVFHEYSRNHLYLRNLFSARLSLRDMPSARSISLNSLYIT